jgi:hypothetical protein
MAKAFDTADTAICLMPTVCAVLFVPLHFFERLPTYNKKRVVTSPLYVQPLPFALSTSGLMLAVFGLSKEAVGGATKFVLLAVAFVFGLPIVVPIACLPFFIAALLLMASRGPFRDIDLRESLLQLCVPVDPRSYWRLNPELYLKALFYFYGYLVFVLIPVAAICIGLVTLYSAMENFLNQWIFVSARWLIPIFIVWLTARFIFYPYAALLVASRRQPTSLMNRLQFLSVQKAAEEFSKYPDGVKQLAIFRNPRTRGSVELQRLATSFLTKCKSAEFTYRRACRLRRQNPGTSNSVYAEALPHFAWPEISRATRLLPLESATRRDLKDVLEQVGCGWAPETDETIPAEESVWRQTVQSQPGLSPEGQARNLVEVFEDAIARADALVRGPADLRQHYADLLRESLEKEIPSAWFEVDHDSAAFQWRVTSIDAEKLKAAVQSAGFELEGYPRMKQVFDGLVSIRLAERNSKSEDA